MRRQSVSRLLSAWVVYAQRLCARRSKVARDRTRPAVSATSEREAVTLTRALIRAERPSDHTAIRDLIVQVFHETYGSGEEEAVLVERLREDPAWGPNVGLVAELDGAVVGHVFFSGVRLEDYPEVPVCALAPLGVYRGHRRQGIGTQLVQRGVMECAKQGYQVVLVTGSLKYYPRFGFVPITETNLHTVFASDHDQVLAIDDGILETVSGLVAYPGPWDVFV